MAGFFQANLQPTNPKGISLKDYRHAAKIFESAGFANAPKFKWLFHVYFEINDTLISNDQYGFPSDYLPGLLVKTINLPKFNIAVSEMNQYNRKRYVQTKINYDPVSISFHDDNAGSIRDLWYKYFSYYYYDPTQPYGSPNVEEAIASLNKKNTYSKDIDGQEIWGLNADFTNTNLSQNASDPKTPFFKSIKIYGFNQHSFALYELINPIIERFEHDTYDYYQTTGTMENRMTIRYETVKYGQGALNGLNPSAAVNGFGIDGLYDKAISPITGEGASTNYLGPYSLQYVGADGFSKDLKDLYQDSSSAASKVSPVENPQSNFNGAQKSLVEGAVNASTNPDTVRSSFNFPSSASVNGPTAQNGSSNNWSNTQPKPIPTPANNPINNG